ncbi:unnamed protein product, partial [Mesorhabditis spiculigera]
MPFGPKKYRFLLLFIVIFVIFIFLHDRKPGLPSWFELERIDPVEATLKRSIFEQHYPKARSNPSRITKYGNSGFGDSHYEVPIDDEAVYVYKAYYDLRDPAGPRIRVLLTSNCSILANTTNTWDLKIRGKSIGVAWKKLTNGNRLSKCMDEGCAYWHYDIASKVYEGNVPDMITFHRNEFFAEIPVERSPSKYTDDISACIGALHWFNDWPRLILYVEMARLNGISRILVTWQSISKEVQAVIDYYQQRGIIKPHPWPLLSFNEKRDPNSNVYIVSHNLFTQHCNFWSSSKYTFLSDVDEMLYMRYHNKTLYVLLILQIGQANSEAGYNFKHTQLAVKMAPQPFEFEEFLKLDGLRKPKAYAEYRFPKSIWLTEYTRVAWVHYAREFFANKTNYDIPPEEALYFHLRENFKKKDAVIQYPDVELFRKDETDERLRGMARTIREIFKNFEPGYRAPVNYALMEECRSQQNKTCDDSGVTCWDLLSEMDNWILAAPTPDSYYIPV